MPPRQNSGSRMSMPTRPSSSSGEHEPPALQHVQILRHERLALALIHRVQRHHQQLAERIRIHVERRADEVAHIHPPVGVLLAELHRVAEHRLDVVLPPSRRSARWSARRVPCDPCEGPARTDTSRPGGRSWRKPPRSSPRTARASPPGSISTPGSRTPASPRTCSQAPRPAARWRS